MSSTSRPRFLAADALGGLSVLASCADDHEDGTTSPGGGARTATPTGTEGGALPVSTSELMWGGARNGTQATMSHAATVGSPPWLSPTADERVWLRAAPSGNLMLAALGVALAIQVGTALLIGVVGDLPIARLLVRAMVVLTFGMLLFAYGIMHRRDYVLTDARAYVGVGVLSKHIKAVNLDRVEDIVLEQPAWQPWVQIGTIRFVTAEGDTLTFAFVENPSDLFRRVVQHAASRG